MPLEITADDPALIDGRGPTQVVEVEVEFTGVLHVWARSRMDLSLRIEDMERGAVLAEDDDSGGGTTPYAWVEVETGDALAVLVSGPPQAESSPGSLHLRAARPADRPDRLSAWNEQALELKVQGDLQGARKLQEAVLEERERTLPPEKHNLLAVRGNLAITLAQLGDHEAARELQEAVLEAFERTRPPGHLELLTARNNLSVTLAKLGDRKGAAVHQEAVLEGLEQILPPDHPDLVAVRSNLAVTRADLGDLEGALELAEAVLEARERTHPIDHPVVLSAMGNLAVFHRAQGDLDGARELLETVLEAIERTLPSDHPHRLEVQSNVAVLRTETGDLEGAREVARSLFEGQLSLARGLSGESPRFARSAALSELSRFSDVLFVAQEAAGAADSLDPLLFEVFETLRAVTDQSARLARAVGRFPELEQKRSRLLAVRSTLNDLGVSPPAEATALEAWREELLTLAERRDQLERELRSALVERGVSAKSLTCAEVAGGLEPNAALISFLLTERYPRRGAMYGVESLLAFVVDSQGAVRRVDLGPSAEIGELVGRWRSVLGRPVTARGVGGIGGTATSGGARGRAVPRPGSTRPPDRSLPRCPRRGSTERAPPDPGRLPPPGPVRGASGGGRAPRWARSSASGSRCRPCGWRPRNRSRATPAFLLALGGVDYGTGEVRPDPDRPSNDRFVGAHGFVPLEHTAEEAQAIAAVYEGILEGTPRLLTGSDTTKSTLVELAPGVRFLHIATHGWFAPETVLSMRDGAGAADDVFARADRTLRGFAPETLCGLALAGANEGPLGILTAEELATLDLSNCELAVLSACETNVGIRRAGQGIQSLQTALHAAGARTAITSLWRVDDAATRRLMELFYTKLWKDGLGKADALWRAKQALRAEGHPIRDWAGWVLTGDPD